MDNNIYVSLNGKVLLEHKLKEIEKQIIETYRLMGESSKNDNDLRENPEYNELQNKVSYELPLAKSRIKEIIRNCVIIENEKFYKNFDKQMVIIGCNVKILFNNEVEIYQIVGYGEEDPFEGKIAYNCRLASTLIGKRINEEFLYQNNIIKIIDVWL